MSPVTAPPTIEAGDLEAEIERLHHSIDGLAGAVSGLKSDMSRQAEKIDQVGARQTSDFKELLSKLHDSYRELVGLQHEAFRAFGDRLDKLVTKQDEQATAFGARLDDVLTKQDAQAVAFGDRLDKLVTKQNEQATAFGDRFDKLLTKQDQQAVAIRGEMRTDFARIVERQDSHFRWLFGLIVVSAISVGLAVYKVH